MTDTLKSVVEEELQKAYERGVQDGMKQERALWELSSIGQEIEHVHANDISQERVHKTEKNEHEPVAWVDSLNGARPNCVTDFKYLSVEQVEKKVHLKYIPLYTAPPKKEPVIDKTMATRIATQLGWVPKKEWRGLTYADLYFWGGELGLGELGKGVLRAVDAHLREKNSGKEWVGLTDEEIDKYSPTDIATHRVAFARVLEAKLKEKNS